MDMCSWVASYTGQAIKERLQDEIDSSWVPIARSVKQEWW